MISDFIPDKGSPFSAGGFRDWIPDPEAQEQKIEVKPAPKDMKPFSVNQLSDEDLRDMGYDPVKVRMGVIDRITESINKDD